MALLIRFFGKCEPLFPKLDINGTMVKVYLWNNSGGMSLSNTIFLPKASFPVTLQPWKKWQKDYLLHEYGHTLQSRKLGWLYLFVIGLPSIIWAGCFDNYRKKHNKSYYSFYTERWADELGGVKRED